MRDIQLRAISCGEEISKSTILHFTMFGVVNSDYKEIDHVKIEVGNYHAVILQIKRPIPLEFQRGNNSFSISIDVTGLNLNNTFRVFYWNDDEVGSLEKEKELFKCYLKKMELLRNIPTDDLEELPEEYKCETKVGLRTPRQAGNGGVVTITPC